jgi:hypothetical protein
MDYHPKEILVTAVYLATKVEEFNVSIRKTSFLSSHSLYFILLLLGTSDFDRIF